MSVRRYFTIVYGYSLPCDFEKNEELESRGMFEGERVLRSYIDGMSGNHWLVGKPLRRVAIDAYETDDTADDVMLLSVSMSDKNRIKAELKELFPDSAEFMGTYCVMEYL